jgi:hypothetical protein
LEDLGGVGVVEGVMEGEVVLYLEIDLERRN